jgi:hydrogenase/urease accessory protein HupE
MFPLMGILFSLFCLGLILSLGAFVPRLRRMAVAGAAALMTGSTSACALSWGLAVGAEKAFSTHVGEIAFFIGYAGGFLLGGCLGAAAALRRLS